MGRFGLAEVLILGTALIAALAMVSWVRSTIARGKARYAAQRQRRATQGVPEPESEPPAKPIPTTVVERERIIERQVLVTRCTFCKKLTPVDLSACDGCGAKL
jgi:hypothetical protein